MLKKQYRLTSSAHIKEVRRHGRSWQNRWFVLVKRANNRPESRFAFSVSRRLGKAVDRNRIKRVMRDCIRRRLASIPDGWDVLLIARQPARKASFAQTDEALVDLLQRSRLQIVSQEPAHTPWNAASQNCQADARRTRAQ